MNLCFAFDKLILKTRWCSRNGVDWRLEGGDDLQIYWQGDFEVAMPFVLAKESTTLMMSNWCILTELCSCKRNGRSANAIEWIKIFEASFFDKRKDCYSETKSYAAMNWRTSSSRCLTSSQPDSAISDTSRDILGSRHESSQHLIYAGTFSKFQMLSVLTLMWMSLWCTRHHWREQFASYVLAFALLCEIFSHRFSPFVMIRRQNETIELNLVTRSTINNQDRSSIYLNSSKLCPSSLSFFSCSHWITQRTAGSRLFCVKSHS